MSFRQIISLFFSMAVFTSIIISCGSSDPPPAPLALFEPEIVSDPDSFSFQATETENVTAAISYTWSNIGVQATVDHSSVVTAGTAVVKIYDSLDSLVYDSGLLASANESSTIGVAGDWTIIVTLSRCYGTLNFRVQKL